MTHTFIRQRSDCTEFIDYNDIENTVEITQNSHWDGSMKVINKSVVEFMQELINETKQAPTCYP